MTEDQEVNFRTNDECLPAILAAIKEDKDWPDLTVGVLYAEGWNISIYRNYSKVVKNGTWHYAEDCEGKT